MSSSSSLSDVDLDEIYDVVPPAPVPAPAPIAVDEERGIFNLIRSLFGDQERKKSKTGLLEPDIPFLISNSLALVPLHPDLISEPYTDRGRMPLCLFSTRPFFVFKSCAAGTRQHPFSAYQLRDDKSEIGGMLSYISVVDVYDSYGLEMVHSYMHHLYHSQTSLRNLHRLAVYLIGSLAVIRPNMATKLYNLIGGLTGKCRADSLFVSYLCSILLSELILLDSKEPKLLAPIEPHTTALPVELLARIFNSMLISKSIAEHVTKWRRCRDLRPGELEIRFNHGAVVRGRLTLDKSLGDASMSIFYIADGLVVQWGLALLERPDGSGGLGFVLRKWNQADHLDAFTQRSVVLYPRREKLCDELSRVDMGDQNEVCAWIVMFAQELDDTDLTCQQEMSELIPLFLDLKGKVLAKLESAAIDREHRERCDRQRAQRALRSTESKCVRSDSTPHK